MCLPHFPGFTLCHSTPKELLCWIGTSSERFKREYSSKCKKLGKTWKIIEVKLLMLWLNIRQISILQNRLAITPWWTIFKTFGNSTIYDGHKSFVFWSEMICIRICVSWIDLHIETAFQFNEHTNKREKPCWPRAKSFLCCSLHVTRARDKNNHHNHHHYYMVNFTTFLSRVRHSIQSQFCFLLLSAHCFGHVMINGL